MLPDPCFTIGSAFLTGNGAEEGKATENIGGGHSPRQQPLDFTPPSLEEGRAADNSKGNSCPDRPRLRGIDRANPEQGTEPPG